MASFESQMLGLNDDNISSMAVGPRLRDGKRHLYVAGRTSQRILVLDAENGTRIDEM